MRRATRQRIDGPSRRGSSGVTLIELMVAMVLGLIVAGAALAVFISNRQTYIATQSLDRLQEGGRVAFELMSRDLRAAATIPCSSETTFANEVVGGAWWSNWTSAKGGLRGYASAANAAFATSSGLGGRVADDDAGLFASGWTDAVEAMYASPPAAAPIVVTAAASGATAPFTISVNKVDGIAQGDLLLACDYGYSDAGVPVRGPAAVLFQADSASGTTIKATNTAGFVIPLHNELQPNGLVSVLHANRWYIGHNSVGGTSLYRSSLANTGGVAGTIDEEIVRGADGLALGYLAEGASSYVAADAVADWNAIVAIRMRLHLSGADKIDGAPIQRTVEHVITIRNRAQ